VPVTIELTMSADPMMLQFTQAPPMQSNEKVWGLLPVIMGVCD